MAIVEWIEPVKDRNQDDIEKVKEFLNKGWAGLTEQEKMEWSSGLKGALNLSDLLRIENNIQVMSDHLKLGLTTFYKNVPDIPDVIYFSHLLSNISAVREAYCIHADTPQTPSMPVNDYRKVNDLEQILYDVYSIFQDNFCYFCGEGLYAGQETGLLL